MRSLRVTVASTGLAALAAAIALVFFAALPVQAQVTPPNVELSLSPGTSDTVEKTVGTPVVPPALDLCLLVDLSGSYGDDLTKIKNDSLAAQLFNDVRAAVPDSFFCSASFVDYPFSNWGVAASGDYGYQLEQDLTPDGGVWAASINSMIVRNGSDGPEAQYEGLYQMATGAGRDVTPAGASLGDIAPGQDPSWRPIAGVTRVVAITTDAPFHVAGDPSGIGGCDPAARPCDYPGPTRNDAVAALNSRGIKVIAIKAPGSGAEMNDVANATDGSVVSTDSSSSQIASAIVEGIGNLPTTVTPQVIGCAPLVVGFIPATRTVQSGDDATFTETIAVPNDPALAGTTVNCQVAFVTDSDLNLGVQTVHVHVLDVVPPQAACVEGVNPAGNTPKAGQKSPGMNEDGFYHIEASDNVAVAELWLIDLGSGMHLGPLMNPSDIKYTQNASAPGVKAGSGDVDYKINGNGDFSLYAVDTSGNVSDPNPTCLVPPPPK